jgi:hypothetical protein
MSSTIEGGCLCGAVRFRVEPPTLFCCHCHCAWCRRAHGSAFVTWFGVPEAAFALASGEGDLRWYHSSAESDRGFCGTCGTTLFFRSKLAPGEVHIALACADGPIDREPALHVFDEARVPWIELGDHLPRVGRDHPGIAKYQAIARAPGRRS